MSAHHVCAWCLGPEEGIRSMGTGLNRWLWATMWELNFLQQHVLLTAKAISPVERAFKSPHNSKNVNEFCLFTFQMKSPEFRLTVAEDGFELLFLLLASPTCRESRHAPPSLAYVVLGIELTASCILGKYSVTLTLFCVFTENTSIYMKPK